MLLQSLVYLLLSACGPLGTVLADSLFSHLIFTRTFEGSTSFPHFTEEETKIRRVKYLTQGHAGGK